MIIGVICFYIRVFVTSYGAAVALTFLASFFIGIIQVGASKILDTWFEPENVSVAYSVQAAAAGIGSSLAFILGAALGLKMMLLLVAILYTILTIIWLVAGGTGPRRIEGAALPKGATKQAWTSKYMWCMAISGSAIVGSTLLINTYVINAFMTKGLQPYQASILGTVLNLSLLAGGYFGSFLMKAIGRYNIVTIIMFVCGAIGYLGAWFTPLGVNTWILAVFGGVLIGGAIGATIGRVPLIPLTGQFPPEVIGTAAGAVEAIKGIITFVVPIAVASAFATNFNAVFIIFAIHCIVGIIFGGLIVQEVGPKGKLQQQAAANAAAASADAPSEE